MGTRRTQLGSSRTNRRGKRAVQKELIKPEKTVADIATNFIHSQASQVNTNNHVDSQVLAQSSFDDIHDALPKRSACLACYNSKRKCDLGYPHCQRCARLGQECFMYYPTIDKVLPRDYIERLEGQVAMADPDTAPEFVSGLKNVFSQLSTSLDTLRKAVDSLSTEYATANISADTTTYHDAKSTVAISSCNCSSSDGDSDYELDDTQILED